MSQLAHARCSHVADIGTWRFCCYHVTKPCRDYVFLCGNNHVDSTTWQSNVEKPRGRHVIAITQKTRRDNVACNVAK